ncbi:hypothetical protein LEN26_007078 [Aphanomyces euteiches]|nr:hypothetical protein LEN26_007078 [Aphanomyces euteiches]
MGKKSGSKPTRKEPLAESLRGLRTLLTMTEKVNNGLRDMVAVSSRMLEEGKAIQGNLEIESASRSTAKVYLIDELVSWINKTNAREPNKRDYLLAQITSLRFEASTSFSPKSIVIDTPNED